MQMVVVVGAAGLVGMRKTVLGIETSVEECDDVWREATGVGMRKTVLGIETLRARDGNPPHTRRVGMRKTVLGIETLSRRSECHDCLLFFEVGMRKTVLGIETLFKFNECIFYSRASRNEKDRFGF